MHFFLNYNPYTLKNNKKHSTFQSPHSLLQSLSSREEENILNSLFSFLTISFCQPPIIKNYQQSIFLFNAKTINYFYTASNLNSLRHLLVFILEIYCSLALTFEFLLKLFSLGFLDASPS